MRLSRVRFTVRRMMIAVAIAASCIGGFRWAALSLEDFTYYGPYTSILTAGHVVVISRDLRVPAALEVFEGPAQWGRWTVQAEPDSTLALAPGTPCVVRVESAWDEDSCYPSRLVSVAILQGEHKGALVAVPREYLRKP